MTDNIDYFNVNSKKRKINDLDDAISTFEDISISSRELQNINYEVSDVFISNQIVDTEQIDICYEESQFEISTLLQYTHILLKHQSLWQLDNSIALIHDYCIAEGILSLKDTFIIIDINSHTCNKCISNLCLHFQAFEKCFLNYHDSFISVSSNLYQQTNYYIVTGGITIIIIDSNTSAVHIYRLRQNKWYCETCPKFCNFKTISEKILCINQPPMDIQRQTNIRYATISSAPIPFSLDENQITVYEQQLISGNYLPQQMKPEKRICSNGYEFDFNLKLERTGIVLYLENDVRDLNECQVYSSICCGPCKCYNSFNSDKFLFVNLDNHYFIHYSLLYEYSEMMTVSRNPLFSYLRAKNNKLFRMGREVKYKYHIVQQAWNAYLRNVDINFTSNFTCPSCKDKPSIIVLDGIAMGTMRAISEISYHTNPAQLIPLVPIAERIFISNIESRKMLVEYTEKGLSRTSFNALLEIVDIPELIDYIKFTSESDYSKSFISSVYPRAGSVIRLFTRTEAVTAIFRFSAISSHYRKVLVELTKGKSADLTDMSNIYPRMYTLELLINSIPPIINNESHTITLHQNIALLLKSVMNKIKDLILKPSQRLVQDDPPHEIDYYHYFPALSYNYRIPQYTKIPVDLVSNCTKLYPKHRRFSPGLVMMMCQHRICDGFQILTSRESTILIYNMLIRKFKTPPSIIYMTMPVTLVLHA